LFGGMLSGAVLSTGGRVIAGARVCADQAAAQALGGSATQCVATAANGHYSFAQLAPGAYDVSASAAGYLSGFVGKERGTIVRASRETAGVDFVLESGGAHLAGVVLDATGGPIPGANIAISFGEALLRRLVVRADKDGHFDAWLTPGRVGLLATADGYASVLVGHVAPSSDLVVRMTPGSSIRGRVVSAGKATPVPEVQLHAVCDHCFSSAASPSAVSASDGSFTLKNLEPGVYSLIAEGDGWRAPREPQLRIGLAETIDDVVVVVHPVPSVSGTVALRDGSACTRGAVLLGPPDVTVEAPTTAPASGVAPPHVPQLTAAIDERGMVRFRSVTAGTYQVVVECEDRVVVDGPTTLQVASSNIDGLEWHVKPGLQLTIRVVDGAERALGDTPFLYTTPARGNDSVGSTIIQMTDASGVAETPSHLTPGKYIIEPYTGYVGEPVEVDLREGSGRVEARLRLGGQGAIEARVETGEGVPIDTARVTLHAHASPSESPTASLAVSSASLGSLFAREATARGQGEFVIRPVTPGLYDLEVDDAVNAPIVRTLLVASAVVRERIVLDRGKTLRGRVLDAEGEPVMNAWVSALCASSGNDRVQWDSPDGAVRSFRDTKRVVTDADGNFVVADLSRSTSSCALRAEEPGRAIGIEEGVKPGDDISISIHRLGTVSGTAHAADESQIGPFIVSITNEHFHQQRSEEVSNGVSSWSVTDVMPGTLQVRARSMAGAIFQQSVELTPGQALTGVRLEFSAGVFTESGAN
jgi:hypothetical protein